MFSVSKTQFGILVIKNRETHGQRSHVLAFILFYFLFPFFFTNSLNLMTFFGFHVFFFFLLHRLAPMAIFFFFFFFILFSFFSASQKLMDNFIKKKKKRSLVPISQTQKIKLINTWYRSYTLTNKQTHKHVHPHNKSKNFFSKYKQNPEVRNEREERGREEGWRLALFGLGEVGIGTVWTR